MQRTIRLDSEKYRLTDAGSVEAFYPTETGYQVDYSANDFMAELDKSQSWEWHETRYKIGRQTVLVSSTNVSPNAHRDAAPHYYLSFDLDGVRGNSDRNIKRTTGWRGTTDDVSVDAHGIVTIRKIRRLKNGSIAITVS